MRALRRLALLVGLVVGCSTVTPPHRHRGPAAASAADRRVRRLAERYVDELLRFDPVLASRSGDHRFDDRWPDWSPAGRQAALTAARRYRAALIPIDENQLSAHAAADRAAMIHTSERITRDFADDGRWQYDAARAARTIRDGLAFATEDTARRETIEGFVSTLAATMRPTEAAIRAASELGLPAPAGAELTRASLGDARGGNDGVDWVQRFEQASGSTLSPARVASLIAQEIRQHAVVGAPPKMRPATEARSIAGRANPAAAEVRAAIASMITQWVDDGAIDPVPKDLPLSIEIAPPGFEWDAPLYVPAPLRSAGPPRVFVSTSTAVSAQVELLAADHVRSWFSTTSTLTTTIALLCPHPAIDAGWRWFLARLMGSHRQARLHMLWRAFADASAGAGDSDDRIRRGLAELGAAPDEAASIVVRAHAEPTEYALAWAGDRALLELWSRRTASDRAVLTAMMRWGSLSPEQLQSRLTSKRLIRSRLTRVRLVE